VMQGMASNFTTAGPCSDGGRAHARPVHGSRAADARDRWFRSKFMLV
jgi:hypothetical protein